ncbi:hypothetical protein [Chitinimonas koreensis]|uniref:hypothetical protein n=1 Tax=Chitinimonas koreensis TaxID=356302 RepID=UPI0005543B33|nr:hypothetical protein [Chitinimonas koreensis]QNM95500.1 hypothetical protein H9L41_16740 [Chitinimonas koreensis]
MQIQTLNRESAQAWLHSVVRQHLASNARRYDRSCYTPDLGRQCNALGIHVDLKPEEGKVVELSEDWLLLKTGRASFFVAARSLLAFQPALGDQVRITPYARRRFDGTRLDAPIQERYGDVVFDVFKLGERVSPLPIDKSALRSPHLLALIEQVEQLSAPDRYRTLAQLLLDAGGDSPRVDYRDVDDKDLGRIAPALRFSVQTTKHRGHLDIRYNRGADWYDLYLIEAGSLDEVQARTGVYFNELAVVIASLIDDGSWLLAKVEVLQAARQRRAA